MVKQSSALALNILPNNDRNADSLKELPFC